MILPQGTMSYRLKEEQISAQRNKLLSQHLSYRKCPFSYCSERYLPNSHGVAVKKKKRGCNHDHSEEEWVMWADLAVSGLQHHRSV